jgi:hypothetical protein
MKRFIGSYKAQPAPIKKYSNEKALFYDKSVRILKRHQYIVSPESLSGDAPKDFIKVYEYGRCKKKNRKSWIPYISKIGHKWYPMESITEHLLTRLGQEWGFRMADSKLYVISRQVRFCSEYFLKPEQELVHGADILSRYLQEDNSAIIEQIDKQGWSQELLSLQFVKNAIGSVFPEEVLNINGSLVDLLLFDAIVGNNDRHFFNWGVVRHLRSLHKPVFSPIYDTARGLFWNVDEKKLLSLHKDKNQVDKFIIKYHTNTKPKIGWDNEKEINHCEMVERLIMNDDCGFEKAQTLFSEDNLGKAEKLLKTEFNTLISDIRKDSILRYLTYRFAEFGKLLN